MPGTALVLFALVLAAALGCAHPFASQAHAIALRAADVTEPEAGNVLLGLDGAFSTCGKNAALKEINRIRKEACDQGVPDPREPGDKLTPEDYVPIKWSSDLERIAQTRAAEASACQSHERPNGGSCLDVTTESGLSSYGENLAWNYSGMLEGIAQWYDEKADWVKQKPGAMTGHYESLISPNFTYIGLGAFAPAAGGWTCTAAEFLDTTWFGDAVEIPEDEVGVVGKRRQAIEVPASSVGKLEIEGVSAFSGASIKAFAAAVPVKLPDAYGAMRSVPFVPLEGFTWKSSAASVASVSADGKVAAKKCGTAKISASVPSLGLSATKAVKVNPKATTLIKVTGKKRSIAVKWKKGASLAKGYQVRYSTKSSMKGAKTVTVSGASKASRTLKKLKSKTKYFVQVRSIAKVGGKIYASAWSKKKSAKAK